MTVGSNWWWTVRHTIEEIGRFCSFLWPFDRPSPTARVKEGRKHELHYDKKDTNIIN